MRFCQIDSSEFRIDGSVVACAVCGGCKLIFIHLPTRINNRPINDTKLTPSKRMVRARLGATREEKATHHTHIYSPG